VKIMLKEEIEGQMDQEKGLKKDSSS